MSDSTAPSTTRLYALKLLVDPSDRCRIAGRLEHIPSGRLHDFRDGPELLSLLAGDEAEGYRITADRYPTR